MFYPELEPVFKFCPRLRRSPHLLQNKTAIELRRLWRAEIPAKVTCTVLARVTLASEAKRPSLFWHVEFGCVRKLGKELAEIEAITISIINTHHDTIPTALQ